MNIKPIKTKKDHKAALQRIEELWEAKPKTPDGDELDVLTTLVDVYENHHDAIDAPDPIEALKFRIDQQNLSPADLTPYIGQRSKVSEVLNYRRKLSLNMIRKLSDGLQIPLESLIKDYDLAK